jgi:hypothetical protein
MLYSPGPGPLICHNPISLLQNPGVCRADLDSHSAGAGIYPSWGQSRLKAASDGPSTAPRHDQAGRHHGCGRRGSGCAGYKAGKRALKILRDSLELDEALCQPCRTIWRGHAECGVQWAWHWHIGTRGMGKPILPRLIRHAASGDICMRKATLSCARSGGLGVHLRNSFPCCKQVLEYNQAIARLFWERSNA